VSEEEKLVRTQSGELDAVLGKKFPVLDDGFIRVIDYMGTDASIVQAARVSYGAGTKKVSEDRGLIRYLMRHRHTTPFEMCDIKLHIRIPMDAWRQWIRHRTASVNEYSTRYSLAIDAAQETPAEGWRRQSEGNKQGSSGFFPLEEGQVFTRQEKELHSEMRRIYNERVEKGVAREQARKDLPLATYTEAYWKTNLHNLFHFLALRMDTHAQYEIRTYAEIIGHEIVSKWCPLAWEAFLDYRYHAAGLTAIEIDVIKLINSNKPQAAIEYMQQKELLKYRDGKLLRNRERSELEEKMKQLELQIPWRK